MWIVTGSDGEGGVVGVSAVQYDVRVIGEGGGVVEVRDDRGSVAV